MARKMIVMRGDGEPPALLTEVLAEGELQLQEQLKNNPDLLPVDEFGLSGPLMVVGRETQLPSGAVDLIALARGGEVLIIEFKTGPQNADFRRVLAQLLDYGSDLWQMSVDDFESAVVRRYFASEHCKHPVLRGLNSLDKAARVFWTDLSEEEMSLFQERIAEQLRTGAFHYLVVAQRSIPTMERTVQYLNASMTAASFYAVELVRFAADNVSAFEARTVLKPVPTTSSTPATLVNEDRFLENVPDPAYREALKRIFEQCKLLGLRFEWGAKGTSIRISTLARVEPFSIGWLFPPGTSGWMGLTDVTLGYDPSSVKHAPSVIGIFDNYVRRVGLLPGATGVKPAGLRGRHLNPEHVAVACDQIIDILTELVQQVNAEG